MRLVIVALLFSSSALNAATPKPGETAREMVERSNAFRAGHGLSAVQPDPALSRAARAFADYMAQTDHYGHEADGRRPVQRAQAAGYVHCQVAENIAWHFSPRGISGSALAENFVQGWINSPPHRRNLLATEATDMAIAVARSASSGRWYAVQMLGRPASLRTRLQLINAGRQGVRYRVDGRAFVLAPGARHWHEQCVAARVEVDLPGAGGTTVLNTEKSARFQIERNGGLRQLR